MDKVGASHHSSTLYGSTNDPGPDKLKPAKEEYPQADQTELQRIFWRKLDEWILPLYTGYVVLAFLDTAKIGNTRVAGFTDFIGLIGLSSLSYERSAKLDRGHQSCQVPTFDVHSSGTILFGLAYFDPSIVSDLGYKDSYAQPMSVPPFAVTFALSLISAILSDHYQCCGHTMIFFSFMQLIGLTMYYASSSRRIQYGSLFFSISGTYCAAPALVTWLANNSAPHVRRATAVAVGSIMAQAGGVLATRILGSSSLVPNYRIATITFIVTSVCIVIFSTANMMYLRREKTAKEEEPGELEIVVCGSHTACNS